MTRVLKIILPFAILCAVGYQFWPQIVSEVLHIQETYDIPFWAPAPCTHPIPYVIGTFDSKFNITEKYFLSALSDAEAIWEKPQGTFKGKNLFTYDPTNTKTGVLKINLVYDYRQETTSKLAPLGADVESNQASYDSLKAKFTALKSSYEQAKSDFSVRVAAFNQKNKAYDAEVEMWNRKGGAPEAEYNKLQADRIALEAQSRELQTLETNLNNMVDEINALVVTLNHLVDSLKLSVEKYNTISSARGESFDEGVYSTNGANVNEINIYEFSSRTKLVRVLAHELGHALGLDHVTDPKAIMYAKNDSSNGTLTKADLAALKTRCGANY